MIRRLLTSLIVLLWAVVAYAAGPAPLVPQPQAPSDNMTFINQWVITQLNPIMIGAGGLPVTTVPVPADPANNIGEIDRWIARTLNPILVTSGGAKAGKLPGDPDPGFVIGAFNQWIVGTLNPILLTIGPPLVAPANTVLPTISGTAQVGSVLTATQGTWTGSPTITYGYQWKSAGTPVGGATGTTYTPVTADIGNTITVTVTATNSVGNASATSVATAAVIAAGGGQPSWVATACPNNATPVICFDFVNNRAWDSVAAATVTPASLLSITRVGTETYDNNGTLSTIATGQLAIGSAGLQIQGQINQIPISAGPCASASGGTCTFNTGWADDNITLALPSGFVHNAGDAPDGTAGDTVTFPAASGTGQASQVSSPTCTVTASVPNTLSFYARSVTSVAHLVLKDVQTSAAGTLAAKIISPPVGTWTLFSLTSIPTGVGQRFFIGIDTTPTSTVPASVPTDLSGGTASIQQAEQTGGTIEMSMFQCNPGTRRIGTIATTGSASSLLVDNISAAGNFATALHAASAQVYATTNNGTQGATATLLGNASAVFLGKNATDQLVATPAGTALTTLNMGLFNNNSTWNTYGGNAATLTAGWSSGSGQAAINGYVITDATTRSMSGTVFLGTTDGTAAPWNGNLLTLEVDGSNPALTASATQPITGIVWGGLLDYQGTGFFGTVSTPTAQVANTYYNYNWRHSPTSFIEGDTWGDTWAGDGKTYITAGDSHQFLQATAEAVFWGSLPAPSFANPPPIGTNGLDFSPKLGANAQANGPCPSGAGLATQCEWKPAGQPLAVNTTATGQGNDCIILPLSRQWETASVNGSYGATYSTIVYDCAEAAPWPTIADWIGLPATNNANVASPTFNTYTGFPSQGIPYPFGFAVLLANGQQDYTPINPDADSLNEYIYILLNNFVSIPGIAVAARIKLTDIQSSITNLNSVDGSGNPAKWCYYGSDTNWHGGGTGCTGVSTDWSTVGTNAQNISANFGGVDVLWMSATYLPATGRYLMLGHRQNEGGLVAAESPHPQGPWTLIARPNNDVTNGTNQYYDPSIIESSVGTDNGRNIWFIPSGSPLSTATAGGLYTIWEAPLRILN